MSDRVKLLLGDCIEVMRTFDAESVDAVVCDPPYSLAFMAREWDTHDTPLDFQEWCEEWARECLRILRPGGHLCAFGATRTYHRLAAGIEDAGFEVRDSLMWVYGSGFPHGLDVSKAIDKAGGRVGHAVEDLKVRLRELFDASGMTRSDVNAACGFRASNYLTVSAPGKRPDPWVNVLPTTEKWLTIKRVLNAAQSDDLDELFAAAEREVVGQQTKARSTSGASALPTLGGDTVYKTWNVTAPATEAARQWNGWGTALKPSYEIIVRATKPLNDSAWLGRIGEQLNDVEAMCSRDASGAESSSERFQAGSPEVTVDSAPARAATRRAVGSGKRTSTGVAGGGGDPTATSASASTASRCWSIVTSWRSIWDELCALTSTSTIATASATTTDWRTLSSCLSLITQENTILDPTQPSGLTSSASAVDSLFAAALVYWRAVRALSAGASASTSLAGRAAVSSEPIVLARKPLRGTVAENVLRYGTGAIHVDACRVATEETITNHARVAPRQTVFAKRNWSPPQETHQTAGQALGRWPANLLLGWPEDQYELRDDVTPDQLNQLAEWMRANPER